MPRAHLQPRRRSLPHAARQSSQDMPPVICGERTTESRASRPAYFFSKLRRDDTQATMAKDLQHQQLVPQESESVNYKNTKHFQLQQKPTAACRSTMLLRALKSFRRRKFTKTAGSSGSTEHIRKSKNCTYFVLCVGRITSSKTVCTGTIASTQGLEIPSRQNLHNTCRKRGCYA